MNSNTMTPLDLYYLAITEAYHDLETSTTENPEHDIEAYNQRITNAYTTYKNTTSWVSKT